MARKKITLTADDKKIIADKVKCSVRFVRMVLEGDRNKDTATGLKVTEVAEKILASKKQMLQSL